MTGQKGFTLMEMVVVLIIVGIAAAFVLPNLMVSIEQTKAQAAKNNLMAIAAAEQKYYEDHGSYSTGGDPRANLSLSTTAGDLFLYNCPSVPGVGPCTNATYQCTANDGTVNLNLTLNMSGCAVIGSTITCTAGGASCPS